MGLVYCTRRWRYCSSWSADSGLSSGFCYGSNVSTCFLNAGSLLGGGDCNFSQSSFLNQKIGVAERMRNARGAKQSEEQQKMRACCCSSLFSSDVSFCILEQYALSIVQHSSSQQKLMNSTLQNSVYQLLRSKVSWYF